MIGKNLGQFHNDFDEVADGYAYHSIFLGKKAYIDMLINDKSEHGVHYRMKGVSLDCIELYANEHNMTLIEVYNKLLHNESITFDLLSTQPRFKYNKNRTMTSAKEFKRKVRFEGDIHSFYNECKWNLAINQSLSKFYQNSFFLFSLKYG